MGTPEASVRSTAGAVSGRKLKPSASGGVAPDQTGQATRSDRGLVGAWLSVSLLVVGLYPNGRQGKTQTGVGGTAGPPADEP